MDNSVTKDNNRQRRFVELLKQIFEMDKSDLDFGIYRILNIRKNEIEKYFRPVRLKTPISLPSDSLLYALPSILPFLR